MNTEQDRGIAYKKQIEKMRLEVSALDKQIMHLGTQIIYGEGLVLNTHEEVHDPDLEVAKRKPELRHASELLDQIERMKRDAMDIEEKQSH